MIKVSCVSYLNSQPFIYGLQKSAVMSEINLSLDIPSVCADKLKSGAVDIGLVPVALVPELEQANIISEYCIGAEGKVETVVLISEVPMDQIETILLDNQSRTSVLLAKVLAEKFWKIQPHWMDSGDAVIESAGGRTAAVIIGDKAFHLPERFHYRFDLSEEWSRFTATFPGANSLPFVFACWVSNKELPIDFIQRFNSALKDGLGMRKQIAIQMASRYPGVDIEEYLVHRISYHLDDAKRKAMQLFWDYARPHAGTAAKGQVSHGL